LLAATVVNLAAAFVANLVVARILGPAEFGTLALWLVYALVAFQLVSLRPWEAVIRLAVEAIEERRHAAAGSVIALGVVLEFASGIVALGIVAAGAVVVTGFFGWDRPLGLLLAACSTAALVPRTVVGAGLRSVGAFAGLSVLTAAGGLVSMSASILGVMVTGTAEGTLLWKVIADALVLGVMVIVLWTRLKARLGVSLTVARPAALGRAWRSAFPYIRASYGSGLAGATTRDADVIVLGFFRSPEEVGVYRLARQFVSTIWALSDPIGAAVGPEIVRRWRDRAAFARFAQRLSVGLGLFALAIVGSSAGFVASLLPALAGADYANAVPLFLIMVLGTGPWLILLWLPGTLYAAGRPGLVFLSGTTAILLSLVLYLGLTPWIGAAGTALGYAIGVAAHPLFLLFLYGRVVSATTVPGAGVRA
jgi:O-antigen/teichoic acid export membrane protein